MKIAVEGCAHGDLEKIYDTIEYIEKEQNYKVDLVICCGDFQSTRNLDDLECMAVPKKYQDICSFYKYYSGEKIAPILTIFIGGNHEASNHLQELPYGGWVAPNIYYLGYAGVVKINGIRIAGISGIYKGFDYFRGHHEYAPYNESTIRSVYHIRQLEVFRLKQLSQPIDICLSHDWPRGISNFGNCNQLLRFKPFLKNDIENNTLGSPPCEILLNELKPDYWFSAHLHCKFSAIVPHDDKRSTKFLALDKCLPRRRFLQILDIENKDIDEKSKAATLQYDLEWLSILHLTNHLISVKNFPGYMPSAESTERFDFNPTEAEKNHILMMFNNDLQIPLNFVRLVAPFKPEITNQSQQSPKSLINPQTTEFCHKLRIDDPLTLAMMISGDVLNHSTYIDKAQLSDNEDSNIVDSDNSILNLTTTSIDESLQKRTLLSDTLPKPKVSSHLDEEIDIGSDSSESLNKTIEESKPMDNLWFEDKAPADYIEDLSLKQVDEIQKEATPPVKKFKRRNESIYGHKSDDE